MKYIDDFGGVAPSRSTDESHFSQPQGLLAKLGLQDARYKSSPPSQDMVWLVFRFGTVTMTVTLPPEKLAEIIDLMSSLLHKVKANLQVL